MMQGDCSSYTNPINDDCDLFCANSPTPKDPQYDERYLDSGLRVRPSDLLENYDILTMLEE